jgi:two-component system invasion response regulator UvrY
MIRILIADDHAIVRQGLKQIVSESPGMVVAGEAANGEEAVALARKLSYDIAIVDIAMPGRGGLDILKDLKSARPSAKIIILSMYPEEQYAIRSLRDGASAYLTKANATEELVHAIQAVAAGRRYITPSVAERLASYVEQDTERLPHESLSDRELQVFLLLGSGKTVTDIARELSLSVKTVSTYRTRILEKMRMNSNALLIRYAIQHKLVE